MLRTGKNKLESSSNFNETVTEAVVLHKKKRMGFTYK
jgi:hypothetical protein